MTASYKHSFRDWPEIINIIAGSFRWQRQGKAGLLCHSRPATLARRHPIVLFLLGLVPELQGTLRIQAPLSWVGRKEESSMYFCSSKGRLGDFLLPRKEPSLSVGSGNRTLWTHSMVAVKGLELQQKVLSRGHTETGMCHTKWVVLKLFTSMWHQGAWAGLYTP